MVSDDNHGSGISGSCCEAMIDGLESQEVVAEQFAYFSIGILMISMLLETAMALRIGLTRGVTKDPTRKWFRKMC